MRLRLHAPTSAWCGKHRQYASVAVEVMPRDLATGEKADQGHVAQGLATLRRTRRSARRRPCICAAVFAAGSWSEDRGKADLERSGSQQTVRPWPQPARGPLARPSHIPGARALGSSAADRAEAKHQIRPIEIAVCVDKLGSRDGHFQRCVLQQLDRQSLLLGRMYFYHAGRSSGFRYRSRRDISEYL